MNIKFGTRGSKLALWQTHAVMDFVHEADPNANIEEVIVKTLGDRVTDRPLFKVGGQGLFIKEIEEALADRRIDLAVHSLKDVPHKLADGMVLAAISKREDPRDALLARSGNTLKNLPPGRVIGTSSLRRRAQLGLIRPDLRFTDLRGNLDTRLRKLNEGLFDAIVLAAAGLRRLGFAERVTEYFSVDTLLPAAGQGFLAIECRAEDLKKYKPLLLKIEDSNARSAAVAERAFLTRLQGGCQVPLAVHAVLEGKTLRVRGFLSDPQGKRILKSSKEGPPEKAEQLGTSVADELLAGGAEAILKDWNQMVGEMKIEQTNASTHFTAPISADKQTTTPSDTATPSKSADQKRAPGKVFLVGSGPGDPGLITVRGLELVKNAEVIVFDALGATTFLEYARPDCELIDAGKRAGEHTLSQDEINAVLVNKAKEGKIVVRLKGGDPMVFGRGGEEIERLFDEGIGFEVVPGVTSAIAGPCYAGIPVTHRDFTSELAIVTGHEADPGPATTSSLPAIVGAGHRDFVPWKSLAGLRTVIFLMGVRQLPNIVEHLIEAGKDPSTPVALVENATSPRQRTVTGTLTTISKIVSEAGIKPPSIIVVGPVVGLRDKLKWLENRPLFGRTIAVTRSRSQAGEFCRRLEELGASVIPFPTIRIEKIKPNPAFQTFMKAIDSFTHLVFTSVNGAEAFWENLFETGRDARSLAGKKIVCIGPVTAAGLRNHGILADVVPETYIAESLLPFFRADKPGRVAILRAESARDMLPDTLTRENWKVEVIVLYRTVSETSAPPAALAALQEGKIDAVTFTSSSTVDGFMSLVKDRIKNPSSIPAVAIGPVTAETIARHGLQNLGTAAVHTIPGLTDKLLEIFRK